jgi:sortase (surface protein transpeptidase)
MLNLGLLPDGTVQIPPLADPVSQAGWYTGSPTPGSQGPAIVLGHVDSQRYGPGVFYRLGQLKPGDTIEITRADHTVAVFRVDGVRSYPKAQFPTHDVYGNTDTAELRLITCGGVFDPTNGAYESNIIAYATMISSRNA